MSLIKLPKSYKGDKKEFQGKPMVSWSQIETWIGKKGFNTGLLGKYEYMRKYFLGETYPDMGWGTFGNEAEAYITIRDKDISTIKDPRDVASLEGAIRNFTPKEKAIMEQIEPLGNFQHEAVIDFKDFVLLGYIDDLSDDFSHIRDYKTKSEGSKRGLTSNKTYQLEVYTLYIQKMLKKEVKKWEYCIIERLGGAECMRGGGRDVLTIGDRIWYEEKQVTPERLVETEQLILDTVKDISDHYKTFLKYNK
jgi:hypothetical protein